jgi:hypothetical protein
MIMGSAETLSRGLDPEFETDLSSFFKFPGLWWKAFISDIIFDEGAVFKLAIIRHMYVLAV